MFDSLSRLGVTALTRSEPLVDVQESVEEGALLASAASLRARLDLDRFIVHYEKDYESDGSVSRPIDQAVATASFKLRAAVGRLNYPTDELGMTVEADLESCGSRRTQALIYTAWQMGLIGPYFDEVHIHDLCAGWGFSSWLLAEVRAHSGQSTSATLWDKSFVEKIRFAYAKEHFPVMKDFSFQRKNVRRASLSRGPSPKVCLAVNPGSITAVMNRMAQLTYSPAAPEMFGVIPCVCHCYRDPVPFSLQEEVNPEEWEGLLNAVRKRFQCYKQLVPVVSAMRAMDLVRRSRDGLSANAVELPRGNAAIVATFQ